MAQAKFLLYILGNQQPVHLHTDWESNHAQPETFNWVYRISTFVIDLDIHKEKKNTNFKWNMYTTTDCS